MLASVLDVMGSAAEGRMLDSVLLMLTSVLLVEGILESEVTVVASVLVERTLDSVSVTMASLLVVMRLELAGGSVDVGLSLDVTSFWTAEVD